jgi:hypothetical protein
MRVRGGSILMVGIADITMSRIGCGLAIFAGMPTFEITQRSRQLSIESLAATEGVLVPACCLLRINQQRGTPLSAMSNPGQV